METTSGSENGLTFTQHLDELRSRVIKSVISLAICSFVVYYFVDFFLSILTKPVGQLVFIAPQEAFITNIKIAFIGGLFLASPFILFQIWRFVASGLKKHEKKYVLIFGPLSFIQFFFGAVFVYFVILPVGMKFLLGFASDQVAPMITISKYISFVGTLMLCFGLIFELPLVILFLSKIRIVNPTFLTNKRKHAIVFIFIAAAIVTPPDMITQVLMAVPLLILYEVGIVFSKFAYKKI
jgi:sec-independent protein translocase protein TatC